jgi:hypothetical protein
MARFRLRRAEAHHEFDVLERELRSLPGAGQPTEEREIERMRNVIAAGRRRAERLQELLDRAEARLEQVERGGEARPPVEAKRARKPVVHEGARIVAARMLSAGQREDEIEAHLERIFELTDPHAVVEEARASGAAG